MGNMYLQVNILCFFNTNTKNTVMQNGSHDNSVPKSTVRVQPNCILH